MAIANIVIGGIRTVKWMSDLISRTDVINAMDELEEGYPNGFTGERARTEICILPTIPAIPIPDNATNGDVLKRLLYGKAIITEFIHDVNISMNNNVIGQFDMEWWNSPYKRGDTE